MSKNLLLGFYEKSYRRSATKDEYLEVYNSSEGDAVQQKYIESAKQFFGDDQIYCVSEFQYERDVDTYFLNFEAKQKSPENKFPPGIYDLIETREGYALSPTFFPKTTHIPLHNELFDIISASNFKKGNNILVYGKPGNGKTQSIMNLSKEINDTLIINIRETAYIHVLKRIPADLKKIIVFEEFTESINSRSKKDVLNFLDGVETPENTIAIMSTNYPEELEANIIDRPSRVRHFLEYKNPNKDQIEQICKALNCDNPEFFNNKDYSVDNIMNIIKTAQENSLTLEEAHDSLLKKRKFLSETFKGNSGRMGF